MNQNKKPLVIFVDDSKTALLSTAIATKSMDINISQFLEATEALSQIKENILNPDLIVTDLNMPVMDGFEFLEELRKLNQTKRIPILMLTTESDEEKKQKGKKLGLTGWIVKPFNPEELQMAIKRVLRI
jgi:two-component system chemotaxis response regulator CheY